MRLPLGTRSISPLHRTPLGFFASLFCAPLSLYARPSLLPLSLSPCATAAGHSSLGVRTAPSGGAVFSWWHLGQTFWRCTVVGSTGPWWCVAWVRGGGWWRAKKLEAGQIRWRTARCSGGHADPTKDNTVGGGGAAITLPISLSHSLFISLTLPYLPFADLKPALTTTVGGSLEPAWMTMASRQTVVHGQPWRW
jgi:hypothetical protein